MADMMAIVSKAVFEKAAGKSPAVRTRLKMDRYVSANKALEPLADHGRLFLVTVRPGDVLWLVGVLEQPKFDGEQWLAKPSNVAITDISSLKKKLKFESGSGINAAPGQLGMSLQAPRKLTREDVALLDTAAHGGDAAGAEAGDAAKPVGGDADEILQSKGARSDVLLTAILDNPDDVAARQVYADALMQRNDPRGELILVEIALAGPLSIRKREHLLARHAELLGANRATWFPYKVKYRTHGGFITSIDGTLQQITAAKDVFDKEPVQEVVVRGIDEGRQARQGGVAAARAPARRPRRARRRRLRRAGRRQVAGPSCASSTSPATASRARRSASSAATCRSASRSC